MSSFENPQADFKDLKEFRSYQKKIFSTKADSPFLGRNIIDLKLEIIENIFYHWFNAKIISINKLTRSTLHQVYQVNIEDKSYIIKINNFSNYFKELNLYTDYFIQNQFQKIKLPNYKVYVVDASRKLCVFDYEIAEFLEGRSIFDFSLSTVNLDQFIHQFGEYVAGIHSIKTSAFGPPDIKSLSRQPFKGIYSQWIDFLQLNLDLHIKCAIMEGIITKQEGRKIIDVFKLNFPKLVNVSSVLLHGDIANHNVLIEDNGQLKLIDWEDCLVGDAVYDIAYFATGSFDRDDWFKAFMAGYKKIGKVPNDFNFRLALYGLRISLFKAIIRLNFKTLEVEELPKVGARIRWYLKMF